MGVLTDIVAVHRADAQRVLDFRKCCSIWQISAKER